MSKGVVIGLTGPTGAGKSTAGEAFARLGAKVIDCDGLGNEILETSPCKEELTAAFGASILGRDGAVSRPALAQAAFSSPEGAKKLNEITHPAILARMESQIRAFLQEGAPAVVVDAALLFESGADQACQATVSVTAAPEIRLARIMRRDAISEEEARARMRAQKDAEYYESRSDYCLDGGGSPEDLAAAVEQLYHKILER